MTMKMKMMKLEKVAQLVSNVAVAKSVKSLLENQCVFVIRYLIKFRSRLYFENRSRVA